MLSGSGELDWVLVAVMRVLDEEEEDGVMKEDERREGGRENENGRRKEGYISSSDGWKVLPSPLLLPLAMVASGLKIKGETEYTTGQFLASWVSGCEASLVYSVTSGTPRPPSRATRCVWRVWVSVVREREWWKGM